MHTPLTKRPPFIFHWCKLGNLVLWLVHVACLLLGD